MNSQFLNCPSMRRPARHHVTGQTGIFPAAARSPFARVLLKPEDEDPFGQEHVLCVGRDLGDNISVNRRAKAGWAQGSPIRSPVAQSPNQFKIWIWHQQRHRTSAVKFLASLLPLALATTSLQALIPTFCLTGPSPDVVEVNSNGDPSIVISRGKNSSKIKRVHGEGEGNFW
jgi:hypothetical protein